MMSRVELQRVGPVQEELEVRNPSTGKTPIEDNDMILLTGVANTAGPHTNNLDTVQPLLSFDWLVRSVYTTKRDKIKKKQIKKRLLIIFYLLPVILSVDKKLFDIEERTTWGRMSTQTATNISFTINRKR